MICIRLCDVVEIPFKILHFTHSSMKICKKIKVQLVGSWNLGRQGWLVVIKALTMI
jgi:hypothetical protein